MDMEVYIGIILWSVLKPLYKIHVLLAFTGAHIGERGRVKDGSTVGASVVVYPMVPYS